MQHAHVAPRLFVACPDLRLKLALEGVPAPSDLRLELRTECRKSSVHLFPELHNLQLHGMHAGGHGLQHFDDDSIVAVRRLFVIRA